MNLVRRALFSGWMLQGLVQNKRWFLPSSVCVNKSPTGCSPFGLCCSVSSSASTFFSFSSSVIYCTVHKFINRNFVSLVLTTFFFRFYHFFSLSKYNCPSYCIGDLITLGLFQEEWRPCYFIYSFTCSFIQPTFDEYLLGVRYWAAEGSPSCAGTHGISKEAAVETVLTWCPSFCDRGEFTSGAGHRPEEMKALEKNWIIDLGESGYFSRQTRGEWHFIGRYSLTRWSSWLSLIPPYRSAHLCITGRSRGA